MLKGLWEDRHSSKKAFARQRTFDRVITCLCELTCRETGQRLEPNAINANIFVELRQSFPWQETLRLLADNQVTDWSPSNQEYQAVS